MVKTHILPCLFCIGLAVTRAATPAPPEPGATGELHLAGGLTTLTIPPPTTYLEGFGRRLGSVIVRGYTDVAGLRDDSGNTVRVLAVEFKNLSDAKDQALGLAIEVHPNLAGAQTVTSLIDEAEIDGLIAGIETLA